MEDWDNLIQTYFQSGFSNSEILAVILLQHNVIMSERTLKRIMHRLNLFRRKHFSPIMDVADYIFELLNTSSQLHGYRWIHLKCLQRGFVVTQRTIRLLLQQLDPHGVQLRSRGRLQRRKYHCPGPNYVWHIDSYDKLKRYGIAINGCIDGFSRKIVWLEAYLTSNDPKVIASYYLDSVEKCGGCPTLVRADLGTENTHLTQMQTFLRSDDDQEQNCVILGSSTNNTRIESWWAICRKHCANFWMRLFHHLKEDGYFTGDVIDVGLIQFCFMKMIQVNSVIHSSLHCWLTRNSNYLAFRNRKNNHISYSQLLVINKYTLISPKVKS